MSTANGNQSVEKTLRIIETLAKAPQPLRLIELSEHVNMPSSTVFRMLNTLIDMGYAYQEDAGLRRYALTTRFLYIGQMAADHSDFQGLVHPYIQELSNNLREMSCVAVMRNNKLRYIDVVENANNRITVRQRIGGSAPMHCTGSGKLFLSEFTDSMLDAFIESHGLPAQTPKTITQVDQFKAEISNCKKFGYAIDDEECEIGMRCVAAPIYDRNHRILACVSISGPTTRMSMERCTGQVIPELCYTVENIGTKICGRTSSV